MKALIALANKISAKYADEIKGSLPSQNAAYMKGDPGSSQGVKPGDWLHSVKHGKMLVRAVSTAYIEVYAVINGQLEVGTYNPQTFMKLLNAKQIAVLGNPTISEVELND